MTDIYTYFTETLNIEPEDASLKQLPVESPCGTVCKTAIDNAKVYLDSVDPHHAVHNPLIESLNAAISIYWVG